MPELGLLRRRKDCPGVRWVWLLGGLIRKRPRDRCVRSLETRRQWLLPIDGRPDGARGLLSTQGGTIAREKVCTPAGTSRTGCVHRNDVVRHRRRINRTDFMRRAERCCRTPTSATSAKTCCSFSGCALLVLLCLWTFWTRSLR